MATELELHSTWKTVPPTEWNALVGPRSPFLEHEFLSALENSGVATDDTGWSPRPLLLRDASGALVAGAPAWLKAHSNGEYVYDRSWARAADRASIPYYPKLVVGVPWTPVPGERLLTHPDADRDAWLHQLTSALRETTLKIATGLHLVFATESDAWHLKRGGAFSRIGLQYQWHNRGYSDFDSFLARFTSRQRKKIRRERRAVEPFTFRHQLQPPPGQIEQIGRLYLENAERYDQGIWLNMPFFSLLERTWAHRIHAVTAWSGDTLIAGAIDVEKGDQLYGRYWGYAEYHPCLHFEVCYYQGIEYALRRGIRLFDPGHGGEHKFRRGFEPIMTRSSHWFPDPRLQRGFSRYAREERTMLQRHIQTLREQSPLRLGSRSTD